MPSGNAGRNFQLGVRSDLLPYKKLVAEVVFVDVWRVEVSLP